MRIITLNVNGIRSAGRANFFDWLKNQAADVVCLQEIKAHPEQLIHEFYYPAGYHHYFFPAEKKGYSGVAIYSRLKPDHIKIGLGWELADKEGRFLQVDLGNLSIASIYLPSGTSGAERQKCKYEFMDKFLLTLQQLRESKRDVVLCGDWNIAHTNMDLKNWRSNQKNSGFLPEERAWLDRVLTQEGFVDAFRVLNQEPDQYTWWSNRGQAYAKNVGWRIDYHIVSSSLKPRIKSVAIYKEQKFSDHAPLIIDYDYELL